jgi:hypothetical protein
MQTIGSLLQQRPASTDMKNYTIDIQDRINNVTADLDELDDTIKV